ncbi:MAG TPA: hypothetical protein VMN56_01390 [Casimicrobiaceae bacterium]|nr:hypothetical protein [Casimicrobiaceae bacterium]
MKAAPRLTAAELATVQGVPGADDYHGPHWATIAAKKARIARLEARMNEMAAQRCDLEDEVAALIDRARAVIAASSLNTIELEKKS